MGTRLTDADEAAHPVGTAPNWNESRYVDFWDATAQVGGWFRIGNRPNEGHAEVSACVYLPDGRVAFNFARPEIVANELHVGGLSWEIVEPWRHNRVAYDGEMHVLAEPWALKDPKMAFRQSPRTSAQVDLECHSEGLDAVMGSDQDHVDLIFLPGQADLHYQHLAHVVGTVRLGDETWAIDGRGGKDHSWGARNWHAKIYLRWLIAAIDDDNGFMLTRAVGPSKQTRSGFVWDNETFHIVDDCEIRNSYAPGPNYELAAVDVTIRSGRREWAATGTPRNWLPLRHRQRNEAGKTATLRIVKSPTDWVINGQSATGHCEYHDLVEDGRPVGLHD